ncbi:hypothetical protein [Sphingobacterium sp. LRF_L2]|uniref:hypothetical protein n=1 Tax=Sphingobacterium sp. LRF_L2 TaxID=3369421 RepID=UPI003F640780
MSKIFCRNHIKWIIVLFFGLFLWLNIFLGEFNGVSDGLTRIGFPLVFLQDTGGKCEDCESLKWFNLLYLIVDIVICLLLSAIILTGVKRIIKRKV